MRSNEVFSCFVARELKKKTEIIKDEDEAKRISKELFDLVKEEQANNEETNKLFDLYFSFETETNRDKALELGKKILEIEPNDLDVKSRLLNFTCSTPSEFIRKSLELESETHDEFLKYNDLSEDYLTKEEDNFLYMKIENRGYIRLLDQIGEAYFEEKKFDEAEKYLNFVLNTNPEDDLGVIKKIACIYLSRHNEEKLRKLALKFPENNEIEACLALIEYFEKSKDLLKYPTCDVCKTLFNKLININIYLAFFTIHSLYLSEDVLNELNYTSYYSKRSIEEGFLLYRDIYASLSNEDLNQLIKDSEEGNFETSVLSYFIDEDLLKTFFYLHEYFATNETPLRYEDIEKIATSAKTKNEKESVNFLTALEGAYIDQKDEFKNKFDFFVDNYLIQDDGNGYLATIAFIVIQETIGYELNESKDDLTSDIA